MAQRLRVIFSRNGSARYLSHLEMMRVWERTFRRAGWRLSYSHGFNPHPRISFASPLPVGVAGDFELLDVYLDTACDVACARDEMSVQLPSGIAVRSVEEVPEEAAALQRLVRAGEYVANCPQAISGEWLRQAVDRVLSAKSLVRQRGKGGEIQTYDLRPMIREMAVEDGCDSRPAVRMVLRIDAQGAGRPDEVLRELGVDPAECRITRVRLLFDC